MVGKTALDETPVYGGGKMDERRNREPLLWATLPTDCSQCETSENCCKRVILLVMQGPHRWNGGAIDGQAKQTKSLKMFPEHVHIC